MIMRYARLCAILAFPTRLRRLRRLIYKLGGMKNEASRES